MHDGSFAPRALRRRVEPADTEYPAGLLDLSHPPESLELWGDGPPAGPWVTVVGSRSADEAGLDAAQALGVALAQRGLGVLSGGALGIDAEAHWACVDAGGRSAAVLPGGLDALSPRSNLDLFRAILETGGLLASERPAPESPRPFGFHRRNALLAAMGRAVVVVQAGDPSGTLVTAEHAQRLGRPLLVVAPGWDDPARSGNRSLLRRGAHWLTCVADLHEALDALGFPPLSPLSPQETQRGNAMALAPDLESALEGGPWTVEELSRRSGLAAGVLLARLTELELCGRLRSLAGGRFQVL